eukprot:scaffold1685_cov390-Prasinococcus_capsulatus_cf.AAC.2
MDTPLACFETPPTRVSSQCAAATRSTFSACEDHKRMNNSKEQLLQPTPRAAGPPQTPLTQRVPSA